MIERDPSIRRNIVAKIRADRPERIEASLKNCVPDLTYRLTVSTDSTQLPEIVSFEFPADAATFSSVFAGQQRLADGRGFFVAVARVHDPNVQSLEFLVDGTVVDRSDVRAGYVALASRGGTRGAATTPDFKTLASRLEAGDYPAGPNLEIIAKGDSGALLLRSKVPFETKPAGC